MAEQLVGAKDGPRRGTSPTPGGEVAGRLGSRGSVRTWRWGLALLLAWSFGLRVWYASAGLHGGRFWDERYGLANVSSFLTTGSLWPVNAFYPTLAWLPQALLLGLVVGLRRLTGWEALALEQAGGFTPLAYFLCRLLQALYGTVSIAATVHVGRRLFDPAAGLLAGLLLAASPWHLRQSALFKPDILLMMLLVVAFAASLRAVAESSPRRSLGAGAWIGLAGAAKYNAAPIALPLVVGELLARRRRPAQALVILAATGAIALLIFVALNPHLIAQREMLERDFGFTLRLYRKKSNFQGGGATPLDLAWHAVTTLLTPGFHGPLIGGAAVLGLVYLAARWWRAGRPVELAMFLSYPLGYVVTYALVTRNQSPHNWLPLLPFTALAAAAVIVAGAKALSARVPVFGRATVVAGGAALVAATVLGASLQAYRAAVPSTWEVVDRELARTLAARGESPPRLIVQEDLTHRLARWGGAGERPLLVPAALLATARPAVDGRTADVEVYLERSPAPMRTARSDEGVLRVASRLLRSRGPALVAYVHPWRERGAPQVLQRLPDGNFEAPETASGELLSFDVVVEGVDAVAPLSLRWLDRDVPLVWSQSTPRRSRFSSLRLPAPAVAAGVRVEGIPSSRVRSVVARRWTADRS